LPHLFLFLLNRGLLSFHPPLTCWGYPGVCFQPTTPLSSDTLLGWIHTHSVFQLPPVR
jgi:hypothetical protein